MEVISIGKSKEDKEAKRKEDIVAILNDLIERVEEGEVDEFIGVSLGTDGIPQLHAFVKDHVGGIGMLELGKTTLISTMAGFDYEME